jgi:flagellar operon protein
MEVKQLKVQSQVELVRQTPVVRSNAPPAQRPDATKGGDFRAMLETKVRFSAHAAERLQQRNIRIGQTELSRISSGMQKAERKGARDSLLLMGDLALVVNVPNKTVITALAGTGMREAVFTNIDSAVVV